MTFTCPIQFLKMIEKNKKFFYFKKHKYDMAFACSIFNGMPSNLLSVTLSSQNIRNKVARLWFFKKED